MYSAQQPSLPSVQVSLSIIDSLCQNLIRIAWEPLLLPTGYEPQIPTLQLHFSLSSFQYFPVTLIPLNTSLLCLHQYCFDFKSQSVSHNVSPSCAVFSSWYASWFQSMFQCPCASRNAYSLAYIPVWLLLLAKTIHVFSTSTTCNYTLTQQWWWSCSTSQFHSLTCLCIQCLVTQSSTSLSNVSQRFNAHDFLLPSILPSLQVIFQVSTHTVTSHSCVYWGLLEHSRSCLECLYLCKQQLRFWAALPWLWPRRGPLWPEYVLHQGWIYSLITAALYWISSWDSFWGRLLFPFQRCTRCFFFHIEIRVSSEFLGSQLFCPSVNATM